MSLCRLEFESHRTRLNAQLEYQQKQLDQQKIKLSKMEESIKKMEAMMAEHKEVLVSCRSSSRDYQTCNTHG